MPKVDWDGAMNQRILMAVFAAQTLEVRGISEMWYALYSKEDIPQPTTQALCKQLQVLKKTARERAAVMAPRAPAAKVVKPKGRNQGKKQAKTQAENVREESDQASE